MNDESLTIGSVTESQLGVDDAHVQTHSHSPVSQGFPQHDENNAAERSTTDDAEAAAFEDHEPTADGAAPVPYTKPQNVLTNNHSPTTPFPRHDPMAQQQQQQQQRMSDQQAVAISETLIRALSGEDVLESFLRKYPRPTPGSGVGVGPIKSTTQRSSNNNNNDGSHHSPEYHAKKAKKLREKRRQLRALQEWEFLMACTPPRRANSAATGLLSFGMTFILFGLHYTGFFALDTVLPAMAICFGGGVQLIAGLLSWTQGLTFAYVSFVSCGAFFLALTCLWMLPNASWASTPAVQASTDYFTGVFFAVWGVLSFFLFVCTPRMNLCILLKVLTTTLCFLCLAGGLMADNPTAVHAGGYFGIISGAAALYLCFASVINEVYDKTLLPVFQTTRLLEGSAANAQNREGHDEDEAAAVEGSGSLKGSKGSKSEKKVA